MINCYGKCIQLECATVPEGEGYIRSNGGVDGNTSIVEI